MQNKITIIFFDLFGVLLGIDQSVVVQYLSRLTETPYLVTRETVLGEPFMRLERGEINFTQYVDEIRVVLPNGGQIKTNSLHDIWMNSKVGEMPAAALLNKLQDHYKVWIISNTSEKHIKHLKTKFNFLNYVDGIITSERAGAHKPSPAIFNFALTKSETDSFSAVFIDDSFANVESAGNIGFHAHHYMDYEKLLGFLNNFLHI